MPACLPLRAQAGRSRVAAMRHSFSVQLAARTVGRMSRQPLRPHPPLSPHPPRPPCPGPAGAGGHRERDAAVQPRHAAGAAAAVARRTGAPCMHPAASSAAAPRLLSEAATRCLRQLLCCDSPCYVLTGSWWHLRLPIVCLLHPSPRTLQFIPSFRVCSVCNACMSASQGSSPLKGDAGCDRNGCRAKLGNCAKNEA